jgi:hypothetical protein
MKSHKRGMDGVIKVKNGSIVDEKGRTLILRGVNLGGSTKVPKKPDGATHISDGFFDHRNASFVGRPFPLEEADEHFSRLKAWGLTFLRFLITWEAVEHEGPGIFDREYIEYVYNVVKKAGEYGIKVFIDPHQDVWGRHSGGDGAPGWTYEAVGLDVQKFSETGAAIVHNTHGDPFPRMIWPTNYTKLAAATMFTLFFGGNDFAPGVKVEGLPVQEFLQCHYINAVKEIAKRLKDLPNVVGYDSLNEPSPGYIGWKDLNTTGGEIKKGETPTPFQTMALGAGYPQRVEVWDAKTTGIRRCGTKSVNSGGISAWKDGHECIWKKQGVWDIDENGSPRLLKPDYFSKVNGRSIDFAADYMKPFIERFIIEIRGIVPDTLVFIENEPGGRPPKWQKGQLSNVVYAAHWYDGVTLVLKKFIPFVTFNAELGSIIFGKGKARRHFEEELLKLKKYGKEYADNSPTLIGEIGIPFDLDSKKSYSTGNFSSQARAMDASLHAADVNLLCYTIWNYTSDNTNQWGDAWNDEDLSIFSRDQQKDPSDINSGGRALQAVVRPYAMATAGQPVSMGFEVRNKSFQLEFRHDSGVEGPTEIFVPNLHYPKGYEVEVTDGKYEVDREEQVLRYFHSPDHEVHTIHIYAKC